MENEQPAKPIRIRKDGKPDARWLPRTHKTGPDKCPAPPAPKDLMPKVISAVLGSRAMTHACNELTPEGKRYLTQALKQDVDAWRQEFAGKLRESANKLLDLTMQEMHDIPAGSRAFALSVLIDKAQLLEGKAAMSNAAVNVQINNYGNVSKEDLIKKLRGEIEELPTANGAVEVVSERPQEA